MSTRDADARLVPFLSLVPVRADPNRVNCEVRLSNGSENGPFVEVVALRPIEAGEVLTRRPLPEAESGNHGGNADVRFHVFCPA